MNTSNQSTKAKVKFITEFFAQNPTATVASCRKLVTKVYGHAIRSQRLHDLKRKVVAKAPMKEPVAARTAVTGKPTKNESHLSQTLREVTNTLKVKLPALTNLKIVKGKNGNYLVQYSAETKVDGSFTLD